MNITNTQTKTFINQSGEAQIRKSTQPLMPAKLSMDKAGEGDYDIYPVCPVGEGKIFNGYDSLAQWIIDQKTIVIDGYVGVFWDKIQAALQKEFLNCGLQVNWINTYDYLQPSS